MRTAAEGASEEELTRDVERLTARWSDIEEKVKAGKAPAAAVRRAGPDPQGRPRPVHRGLHQAGHPGRRRLGPVEEYVDARRARPARAACRRYERRRSDVFAAYRIDEQIAKGLDRKVWLPSGGSLVIDRTEAMTVVDVNTGKFTGSGGNLEETVTKNNLEAAEEIVRQLRLRDIGGIIVVDFIDMVLESNRDLVLRRLVECLGRDRTRHQVAEVTSLGLVQMTRKRIGTGLLEAFSTPCETCHGRGVVIESEPVRARGEEPQAVPQPVATKSTRRSSSRKRGSETPAAEVDAELAAKQHSAAAAAAAAMAAALHPEQRNGTGDGFVDGPAEGPTRQSESGQGEPGAAEPAAPVKKAATRKRSAKKSAPTDAAKAGATPGATAGAKADAKTGTAKKTVSKRSAAKKTAAKAPAADRVAEPVGSGA